MNMDVTSPVTREVIIEFLHEVLGVEGLVNLVDNYHLSYIFGYRNTYFFEVRADIFASVHVKITDLRRRPIGWITLYKEDLSR